jgi:hypothetical protein
MTQHRQHVPENERAHGLGATGGLPGANADPRASLVNEDELASTVDRGDVNDGLDDVEREVDRRDPRDPDVSGHMLDGSPEGADDDPHVHIGGTTYGDPMIDGRLADGSPVPRSQEAAGGSDDATGAPGGSDDAAGAAGTAGGSDNAAANAAPAVAGDVLGAGATDGVADEDVVSSLDPGDESAHGGDLSGGALTNGGMPQDQDRSQPRTGAEQPVDAEDLVHARGQDVTSVTLSAAQEDLERQGSAAVRGAVPGTSEDDA